MVRAAEILKEIEKQIHSCLHRAGLPTTWSRLNKVRTRRLPETELKKREAAWMKQQLESRRLLAAAFPERKTGGDKFEAVRTRIASQRANSKPDFAHDFVAVRDRCLTAAVQPGLDALMWLERARTPFRCTAKSGLNPDAQVVLNNAINLGRSYEKLKACVDSGETGRMNKGREHPLFARAKLAFDEMREEGKMYPKPRDVTERMSKLAASTRQRARGKGEKTTTSGAEILSARTEANLVGGWIKRWLKEQPMG